MFWAFCCLCRYLDCLLHLPFGLLFASIYIAILVAIHIVIHIAIHIAICICHLPNDVVLGLSSPCFSVRPSFNVPGRFPVPLSFVFLLLLVVVVVVSLLLLVDSHVTVSVLLRLRPSPSSIAFVHSVSHCLRPSSSSIAIVYPLRPSLPPPPFTSASASIRLYASPCRLHHLSPSLLHALICSPPVLRPPSPELSPLPFLPFLPFLLSPLHLPPITYFLGPRPHPTIAIRGR